MFKHTKEAQVVFPLRVSFFLWFTDELVSLGVDFGKYYVDESAYKLQKWLKKFSFLYPCIIQQTGNENTQTNSC